MSQNYWDNPNPNLYKQTGTYVRDTGLAQFFTQIYTWMTLGLAITGLMAIVVVSNPAFIGALVQNRILFFGLIIAELLMVMAFTTLARRGASFSVLAAMFVSYAALNGVTLSIFFLVYTLDSIAQCFFVTAASFGALSVYGYVTKRDLSSFGRFLFMGLVGLIVASLVGLFWHSSTLHTMISMGGVLIFAGLTAYDTNRLKALYAQNQADTATLKRLSLNGALMLYLDFINLMLYLLRFMGRKK